MMNANPRTYLLYEDGKGFLATQNEKVARGVVTFKNKENQAVQVYVEDTSILELSNYGFKHDLQEVSINESAEEIAQHEKANTTQFEGKTEGLVGLLKKDEWKGLDKLSLRKFFKKAKPVVEPAEQESEKKHPAKKRTKKESKK